MFLLKESENRAKNNVPHVVVAGFEPARSAKCELQMAKPEPELLRILCLRQGLILPSPLHLIGVYHFRHTTSCRG